MYSGQDVHSGSPAFEQHYRCYSSSSTGKPQIKAGNKVIMPPSALDRLTQLEIEFLMLFEIRKVAGDRSSHCGVLEFTAQEGMILLPHQMMLNLELEDGDSVLMKGVTLPGGEYVKLQPHTKDFLDNMDPKTILEATLRYFPCLTTGDTIMVTYNNHEYYFNILETRPSDAICIIDTDCEVDFATPLDYRPPPSQSSVLRRSRAVPALDDQGKNDEAAAKKEEEEEEEEDQKSKPFTGVGRRLDGRPSTLAASTPPSSIKESKNSTASTSTSSTADLGRKTKGKFVFGSNSSTTARSNISEEAKEVRSAKEEEESKFQAFSGKSCSLLRDN